MRGEAEGAVQVRRDAPIGFATGALGAPRTSYEAMIERVRAIADKAAQLINSKGDERA